MKQQERSGAAGTNTPKWVFFGTVALFLTVFVVAFFLTGETGQEQVRQVQEMEAVTFGVDVAKYQGTVDWQQAAEYGVDFAMVRVGYRGLTTGELAEDSNARYNLQEARKYGIKLGAYFFSTAVSAEEAVEEANWVADILDGYPITYPVAYDCEGFAQEESRQYGLTVTQRTDIALAFMEAIEQRGYEGMFYASRNDMQDSAQWEMERIETEYKVWVAQYPQEPYPQTPQSSYTGFHQMWQYSADGAVPGISQAVDLNIAYFGYDGVREPISDSEPEAVEPDPEALMAFREVRENVTAKELTNLRSIPSQDADSKVLGKLINGQVALRVGISDSGWSKLEMDGHVYYAVSSYLTTDMDYQADDGITTVFTQVDESVTPKKLVNLRTLPSVDHPDSAVAVQISHGEVVRRTGINTELGWSRVEYNGKTLYCVSSYLETVK